MQSKRHHWGASCPTLTSVHLSDDGSWSQLNLGSSRSGDVLAFDCHLPRSSSRLLPQHNTTSKKIPQLIEPYNEKGASVHLERHADSILAHLRALYGRNKSDRTLANAGQASPWLAARFSTFENTSVGVSLRREYSWRRLISASAASRSWGKRRGP